MDVVKLTDRIMIVDVGIDKTLVVVKIIDKTGSCQQYCAAVVRKYERPSVTLRSALLNVSNSTASRIA
jgi:hypothetical protein